MEQDILHLQYTFDNNLQKKNQMSCYVLDFSLMYKLFVQDSTNTWVNVQIMHHWHIICIVHCNLKLNVKAKHTVYYCNCCNLKTYILSTDSDISAQNSSTTSSNFLNAKDFNSGSLSSSKARIPAKRSIIVLLYQVYI